MRATVMYAAGDVPVETVHDPRLLRPADAIDRVTDLDGVPEGYRAMNEREAIKVMVTFP